jgi:signal peptidase I
MAVSTTAFMPLPVTLPPVSPDGRPPLLVRRARVFAVLSNLLLWPGIGHFFAGRFAAGLVWAIGSLALVLASPLHPLLALVGMVGARLLSPIEVGFRKVRPLPANQTVPWVVVGVVSAGVIYTMARSYYIEGFKIPSGSMLPTLAIGDHFFINKLVYRFGEVERGDVVVFTNPCQPDRDFVSRVVGLPGDTIEVRCDVLHVNGRAVPQRLVEGECRYADQDGYGGPWRQQRCSRHTETLGSAEHDILQDPSRPELDEARRSPSASFAQVAGRHDFPDGRAPGCDMVTPDDEPAEPRDPGRVVDQVTPPANACAPQRHYVVPARQVFVMGDNRDNASDSRAWGGVPLHLIKGRATGIWWSSNQPDGIRWDRIGPFH